jgi:Domain of unknown function (DUF4258)
MPKQVPQADSLPLIRRFAEESRVAASPHAKKQMARRRISITQACCVLQKGIVTEGPFLNSFGHWQVTVDGRHAGDDIRVVAALQMISDEIGYLVIVTTHFLD